MNHSSTLVLCAALTSPSCSRLRAESLQNQGFEQKESGEIPLNEIFSHLLLGKISRMEIILVVLILVPLAPICSDLYRGGTGRGTVFGTKVHTYFLKFLL